MKQLMSVLLYSRENYDQVMDYITNELGDNEPIINDGREVTLADCRDGEDFEERRSSNYEGPQIVFEIDTIKNDPDEVIEYLEGIEGVEECYEF